MIEKIKEMKFKCAIFDLDGTLLKSTDVWAQIDIEFLRKRGIEVTKEFMEAIKTKNFKEGSEYVVERYGLNERPEDIVKEWFDMAIAAYTHNIDLKPYAREYLCELKNAGIKLVVATASDRLLYEPCLKRNGIYDLFDDFTQSDEVERGKGFPDIYIRAAEKCGVSITDCVVYEDILKGVCAAKDGGFTTVAVYDKSSEKSWEEIKQYADMAIYDYSELLSGEWR